ncbi:hypothetical protein HaLaN_30514 [Haematococcus lacustris]|uniref:Uncharacterized protein n=1 Tax=Haematococcus lacustris TaxID=44745 RepID=A0A6A0AFM7_HAELA|nr:hypothetical protein HaLaN_30514 [Haematococcus lacustris]
MHAHSSKAAGRPRFIAFCVSNPSQAVLYPYPHNHKHIHMCDSNQAVLYPYPPVEPLHFSPGIREPVCVPNLGIAGQPSQLLSSRGRPGPAAMRRMLSAMYRTMHERRTRRIAVTGSTGLGREVVMQPCCMPNITRSTWNNMSNCG